jgi:hypothetical protein
MAGIRTFSRFARTAGDETTISPDATLRPPFKDKPLTRDGFFSDPWIAWLTKISDRLAVAVMQSTAISATMYTGTSTTDGSGVFTATWPTPFPSAFGGLSIANTDPAYPGGVVVPTTITLSSYTGTLSRTDNLYPTATMTPQAGVTFGWVVQGY